MRQKSQNNPVNPWKHSIPYCSVFKLNSCPTACARVGHSCIPQCSWGHFHTRESSFVNPPSTRPSKAFISDGERTFRSSKSTCQNSLRPERIDKAASSVGERWPTIPVQGKYQYRGGMYSKCQEQLSIPSKLQPGESKTFFPLYLFLPTFLSYSLA